MEMCMNMLDMYERERQRAQQRRDGFDAETRQIATARLDISPHHYAQHKGDITLGLRGGYIVAAYDVATEQVNEYLKTESSRLRSSYNHERCYQTVEGALDGEFRNHLRYNPSVVSWPLCEVLESEPKEKPLPLSSNQMEFSRGRSPYINSYSMIDTVRESGVSPLEATQRAYLLQNIAADDPRCYAAFLATEAHKLVPNQTKGETGRPEAMGLAVEDAILRDRSLGPDDLKAWAATVDRDTSLRLAAIEKVRKTEVPGSLRAARDLEALGLDLHNSGRGDEALLPLTIAAQQAQAARHLVRQAGRPSQGDEAR
jgi:hypothetical protein